MNSNRQVRITSLLLVTIPLYGCFGGGGAKPETVHVSGTVTYRGAPLSKGQVTFIKKGGGDARPAIGIIDENGRYEMSSYGDRDGVVPGEYDIVVVSLGPELSDEDYGKGLERKSLIPKRYGSVVTSGLSIAVDKSLEHDIVLRDD